MLLSLSRFSTSLGSRLRLVLDFAWFSTSLELTLSLCLVLIRANTVSLWIMGTTCQFERSREPSEVENRTFQTNSSFLYLLITFDNLSPAR